MIQNERDCRHEHVLGVARQMMTAARTAPKGKGVDVIEIDELIEELKNTNEEWIIVGEAVYKYEDKIKDIANIHVPAPSHNVSKASSLCSIAIEKYNNNIDVYDCYSINPLYIRKSQAEVQYDEKMKRLNDGK